MRQPSRQLPTFAKLLLLVGSAVVALALVEVALRFTGRFPIPPARVTTERPEMYEAYPPYGYRLRPSRTMTYSYPRQNPRQLTVHANRHGFRGARELDEADARTRILVVGDSFVFGEGVEESERFTDRIEAAEPGWRVDNLGMTGFGPDLMLRAFQAVGLGLKPDVVVLAIYTDDFRRVRPEYAGAGFEIPRFAIRSGALASIDYPRETVWSRWSSVVALRRALWSASGLEWTLNEKILDRFRADAAAANCALLIAFLPAENDLPPDVERRRWLREYAARTSTPFRDLTEAVLDPRERPLFIPGNWHLNPAGHAVVARELVTELKTITSTALQRQAR